MPAQYLKVWVGGKHPLFPGQKIVTVHRLVMAEHLGRQLLRHEAVHHRDGDKRNNDLSNLELMTLGDHKRLHCKGVPRPPEVRAKISAGLKGHSFSEETIEKMRLSNLGQKRDPEVGKRLSVMKKGVPLSDANKEGIRRSWTPERRAKRSAQQKEYMRKKREAQN